ncbi:hypothetical protein AB4Z46_34575 [Variovorax sp. M-6]|uniref:hypothetical protein n=1 Tax=Variovorax sp. M-6 TaxID=3233041 RepID=UPI003F9D7B50
MKKPSSDSEDDEDTAFGGLAPRDGPEPAPGHRGGPRRWRVAAGVLAIALVVLALWYFGGRS